MGYPYTLHIPCTLQHHFSSPFSPLSFHILCTPDLSAMRPLFPRKKKKKTNYWFADKTILYPSLCATNLLYLVIPFVSDPDSYDLTLPRSHFLTFASLEPLRCLTPRPARSSLAVKLLTMPRLSHNCTFFVCVPIVLCWAVLVDEVVPSLSLFGPLSMVV